MASIKSFFQFIACIGVSTFPAHSKTPLPLFLPSSLVNLLTVQSSPLTPSHLLIETKLLAKISQFKFLVMTEKSIFASPIFLSPHYPVKLPKPEKGVRTTQLSPIFFPYQLFTRFVCCFTRNTLSTFACSDQFIAKNNAFSMQNKFFFQLIAGRF